MKTTIHTGYVIDDATGNVYAQIPADNAVGFVICDDDQTWDFPPFSSWSPVADDDPRVSDDDRERLQHLIDDAIVD